MKRHSRHGDGGLPALSLRNYLIISISYFDVKTVIFGLYAAKKCFVTNIEVFCRNNSERWRGGRCKYSILIQLSAEFAINCY